jgi:hypothetical protein
VVRGHDAWSLDQPDVQADLRRRNAAKHANTVLFELERAKGAVEAVLADPDLPAASRDRLTQMCTAVGVLAFQRP